MIILSHPIDSLLVGNPIVLSNLVTASTIATVVALGLAMFWLIRRPKRAIAPECARCGYPQPGSPGAACSECGADLTRARGIRTHRGRGISWTRGIAALLVAALLVGAQASLGLGWLPFGKRARTAVGAMQVAILEPDSTVLSPEFFVARAMDEVSVPGFWWGPRARFAQPGRFSSRTRLLALREALEDPQRRGQAFMVLRGIQASSTVCGCIVDPLIGPAEHALIRDLTVDAVVADPTLLGARPIGDGAFELDPVVDTAPRAADHWPSMGRAFASDSEAADPTAGDCYIDLPSTTTLLGVESSSPGMKVTLVHPNGARTN